MIARTTYLEYIHGRQRLQDCFLEVMLRVQCLTDAVQYYIIGWFRGVIEMIKRHIEILG